MSQDSIQSMFDEKKLLQHIKEANSGGDYERWRQVRQFIVQAIHKDGTLLDVGCANGFFLKCLLVWCNHRIMPFGVDHREEVIEKAKQLLPEYSQNFVHLDGDHLEQLEEVEMPVTYDFVYRNYWKRDVETPEKVKRIVDELWKYVNENGRLLLGVYWGSDHPSGSDEEKQSRKKFQDFTRMIKAGAGKLDGEAFSESGFHWVMWMDKNS